MKRVVVWLLGASLLGGSMIGCQSKAGTGALVGGAVGAGVGGVIGNNTRHGTGKGALVGGAAGALTGALIGNEMDRQDRRNAQRAYERRAYRETTVYESRVSGGVTKQDVIRWTAAGERDDVIIDRIEYSGTVFHLTGRDQNQLRDAGVSEEVIRTMRETARR